MDRWPNFFIVGAPKAGTTSLYEYLNKMPDIFMSSIKEPNYFLKKKSNENNINENFLDKAKYLELFKNVKNEKIVGEASPTYLANPDSPNLICQVSPNAKILISLRDPVERLFSYYLMMIRLGNTKLSFHEKILSSMNSYQKNSDFKLEGGLYYENVKRYLETFGKNQVKIIIFEEFVENPKNILNEILDFLEIKYNLENFNPIIFNAFAVSRGPTAESILRSKIIRNISGILPKSGRKLLREKILLKKQSKPKMFEDDRILLKKFYSSDVDKLMNLIERKLPWENFSD